MPTSSHHGSARRSSRSWLNGCRPTRSIRLADRYRELYAEVGIAGTLALPGAAASLDAVRLASGRTLVVTAKFEPNAWLCLEQTNLDVDDVVGWRHGPQKGETLLEHGASVYVGDTPPDMEAARIAGAVGVAVPTGPFTGERAARRGRRHRARIAPGLPDLARIAPCITRGPHGLTRRLSAARRGAVDGGTAARRR